MPRPSSGAHNQAVAEGDVKPMDRLPTDPTERAMALVERARPSSTRPRLSDPALEAKLSASEQERAVRYTEREDLSDRLRRVTEMVDSSEDGVIEVEIDDDPSIVRHVTEIRGT